MPRKAIRTCPHCLREFELVKEGNKSIPKKLSRFRSNRERKEFYEWLNAHGVVCTKDSDDELCLLRKFREEID